MSLRRIQRLIKGGYSITPDDIEREYCSWVVQHEMLIFSICRFHEKRRFIASLSPKRGNEKYAYRVKKKFKEFIVPFDEEKKREKTFDETETQVIFVTLTYDTKLRDWASAWSRPHVPHHQCAKTKAWEQYTGIKKKYKTGVGEDWNRFLSNIKKLYGRALVARCFESTEAGYPHIHAVIYLPEYSFPTWLKWSKKEKRFIWRIPYQEKLKMNAYYHSDIDVQGMPYLADGMRYISKYISKGSDLKAGNNRSLSMNWAFRKRSFSIGKKFKEEIFRKYLDLDLTPNIVTQTVRSQRTLYEKDIKEKISGSKYITHLPDGKPLKNPCCLDAKHSISLDDYGKIDKISMLGVFGRQQLKKLGGLPKNEWSFGCNDTQTVACWYRFYELKPDYVVNEYEERIRMLKNPFKDVYCKEETEKIHDGLNKKLVNSSPVDDYDWWVKEGQFLTV